MMDQSSRWKLTPLNVLLLMPACIVCLHGNATAGDHDLHCVNDYLFTINCTITIAPSDDHSSYWLTITKTFKQTFVCMLTNSNGDYFCSVQTFDPTFDDDDYPRIFSDLDSFKISLCQKQSDGSEMCQLLDGEYTPFTNIKPNAPRNLTVEHNSSRFHFTWESTYEEYEDYTDLGNILQYQLYYSNRGDGENTVKSRNISTNGPYYYMDDAILMPNTEYAARVRSSPNQVHYKGHWSDWSSEVHWKTVNDLPTDTFVPELATKLFISMCVVVPLALLLCYAPVKKWRQSEFIPSPAPYFHTLYSDCHGDFKSWVVTQENTADMLTAEASLQIHTLIKCQPQFHQPLTKGSIYCNIDDHGWDSSLLGVPFAASTQPGSLHTSASLSSEPGNEYCTLSAFQQTGQFTDEHHEKTASATSGLQGIQRADAIGEV